MDQQHHHEKKDLKSFFSKYFYLFLIILVLLISLGIFLTLKLTPLSTTIFNTLFSSTNNSTKIELIFITTTTCPECYNLNHSINLIINSNITLKSKSEVDYNSPTGQQLIKQYNLSRVPAIIIKGNLDNSPQLLNLISPYAIKENDNYIINNPSLPYLDTTTNLARGQVFAYYITKENCPHCKDLTSLLQTLGKVANFKNVEVIPSNLPEGQAIIKKYNLTFLPTIIISQDAYLYKTMQDIWPGIGSVEKDGNLILRTPQPPYFDISSGEIKGLVTATLIKDKTCLNCTNISKILNNMLFYIPFAKERELNSNIIEAQGLIQKYKITTLPTIILTGDLQPYSDFKESYSSKGSFEYDGTYVLRTTE